MRYECMDRSSSCPWSKDAKCFSDSADRCEIETEESNNV